MHNAYWVAIGAAVLAPALTWLLVRKRTTLPILWALGGLAAHLLVGNVMNRVVMPAVSSMPTGVKRIPRRGEYQHGSLAEYQARVAWLRRNMLVSLGFGLVAAAGLGLVGRRMGRSQGADAAQPAPPQLVGQPCAACGERIALAPDALPCPRCGTPLHRKCLKNHTC